MAHPVTSSGTKRFSSKSHWFLSESNEFKFTGLYRSSDMNQFLLNVISSSADTSLTFDTDSHSVILDCSASSSATSNESIFIEGTCKPLAGVTISGITSGLQAWDIGSIMLHLVDDDDKAIGMQTCRALHLKVLLTMLLRPQQILQ